MKKLITILFVLATLGSAAQTKWSEKMAAAIMNIWKDSFALDGKPAKWTYDMGVILKGMEATWLNTGNPVYYNYIQQQMDFFVQNDGSIKTYKPDEYNIDHINNGRAALLLYRVTLKDKYLKAAKLLRRQLYTHPRTNEGGFWHKKIYPYQMWLDGLYMAEPFYAEYSWLAHDDTAFNDIANQFIWIENHTRDAKTGLLYHAWDENREQQWANKATGNAPNFWARAMGWYACALVDVLEYFPERNPKRKNLIDILNRLVAALLKQQDAKTGLWYDVMNYTGPGKEKNYFESSAACQFVYAIAKATRLGYVVKEKFSFAAKAYSGIINKFIKEENGQTILTNTVKVSGLGGKPYRDGSFDYYMSEPVISNDPKGMGAFLLAANEMELSEKLTVAAGKKVIMDNYFNRETKIDSFGNKIVHHYKWNEYDNGGFLFFGHQFKKLGAATSTIDEPTKECLKNAAIYILVDPDWPKENKSPNYIEQKHVDIIYNYVKNGGVLLLMANDSNNVEFKNYNKLAEKFGIHWNENVRHDVKDNHFEEGQVMMPATQKIFSSGLKAYIKQLCTQQIKPPAKSIYAENGEVMISMAKVGKGTVFAVGDPWFYNEYTDGRKLPVEYKNYQAAAELAQWLLKQAK